MAKWVDSGRFQADLISKQTTEDYWLGTSATKLYNMPELEKTKLATMVRLGIPNHLRGRVYAKILKVDKMDEFEKNFEMATKRTYGAIIPKSPLPPTFGGRAHQSDLALSAEGVLMAEHILCILGHDFPSLEYCPFVTTLTMLLCHHMECENDALGAMVSVVKQAFTTSLAGVTSPRIPSPSLKSLPDGGEVVKPKARDWKLFPTYRKDVRYMSRGFSNLLYATYPKVHQHMTGLQSSSSEPIWSRWLTDFYVGTLPQTVVWRIVDSFLVEGYKTLYRVGIALIGLRKEAVLKSSSLSGLDSLFSAEALSDTASEAFLSAVWSVRVPAAADVRSGAHLHSALLGLSVNDDLHETHFRFQRAVPKLTRTIDTQHTDPSTFKGSAILKEEHWIVFWSWIPPKMRMADLELVFTTRDHGHSISTLFNRTMARKPLMLIVETQTSVFGAFLSEPWPEDDSGRGMYYGTGETFLFTLAPFAKLYPWVGRVDDDNQDQDNLDQYEPEEQEVANAALAAKKDYLRYQASMFIMARRNEITVGGGGGEEGLWLNEDLSYGRTGPCLTFENSPLTGNQQKQFDCLNVECFAFVS
ncbi:hypothetical protein HDU78_001024 [Chytriomyces hyalinus]|nr:hypothetical protein HDU78_001024 [Chytriomyces hyalinus]